jgi:hypothetical protein
LRAGRSGSSTPRRGQQAALPGAARALGPELRGLAPGALVLRAHVHDPGRATTDAAPAWHSSRCAKDRGE